MSSARYWLGLAWANNSWTATVNYHRATQQNDVTEFQLPTEAFNDLSLRANKRFELGASRVTAFLQE